MIDKPLIIILFLYISSFMFLGVQFLLADAVGITMTNFEGVQVKSKILDTIKLDRLNEHTENFVTDNTEPVSVIEQFVQTAGLAWELLTLLTGTYIFNILVFFGVPEIFVTGLVVIYIIMFARSVIGYVKG